MWQASKGTPGRSTGARERHGIVGFTSLSIGNLSGGEVGSFAFFVLLPDFLKASLFVVGTGSAHVSPTSDRSSQPDPAAGPEEGHQELTDAEQEAKSVWSISEKTTKHILELLCDESVSCQHGLASWG